MPKTPESFHYTRDTLSEMSGWPVNRIYQDEVTGVLDTSNLASVTIWLAANGTDIIRAAMASRLFPALFGTNERGSRANGKINMMCKSELLRTVFAVDNAKRQMLAKRKGPKA